MSHSFVFVLNVTLGIKPFFIYFGSFRYIANEFITQRLAQSQTFQNLAQKTHQQVQKTAKAAVETRGTFGEEFAKVKAESSKFASEVKDELGKEFLKKK